MAKANGEDIAKGRPVDATAAKVTSKPGRLYQFNSRKVIAQACSDVPLPTRQFVSNGPNSIDLTGWTRGRFTVIGAYAESSADKVRWVVRCSCGNYAVRTTKSVKNENNTDDCCEECRELKYLRRKDEYRRHGRNFDERR